MDWSANGWTLLGLILAVPLSMFSGGVFWLIERYKTRLQNELPIRFAAIRALTAPGPLIFYLRHLEGSLNMLDRLMGKRARLRFRASDRGDWWQSWAVCAGIAAVYPSIFLIITWMLGGTSNIGGIEILPPQEFFPQWRQALLMVILLAEGIGFYLIFRHMDAINRFIKGWLDRHLWQSLPDRFRWIAKIIPILTRGALVFAFLEATVDLSFNAALASSLIGALAFPVVVAFVITVAVALEIAGAASDTIAAGGVPALAYSVAIAGALIGAGASFKARPVAGIVSAFILILFFIFALSILLMTVRIEPNVYSFEASYLKGLGVAGLLCGVYLPAFNALYDWPSWQVSRWLGAKLLIISKDYETPLWRRGARYIWDMLVDSAFALTCLVGLAWTVPQVISGFDTLYQSLSEHSLLDVGDYLCRAAEAPLTHGLWATAMLFSTLLPTAIHFAFLLFAPLLWLLTPSSKSRARAAHLLHGCPPPKCDLRGWSRDRVEETWPTAQPGYAAPYALAEDQTIFTGPANETTLQAIAVQLCFLRPLYYLVAVAIVLVAIYWLSGLLFTSWYPLPQFLLWVASNFDWSAVQTCFQDDAPLTAPF